MILRAKMFGEEEETGQRPRGKGHRYDMRASPEKKG